MRVFVTGGTGYLGRAVVQELIRSNVEPALLVRNRNHAEELKLGCPLHEGDIRDIESLRQGMRGARAVLHMAALVRRWVRDAREYEAVNVDGLRNVLAVAESEGIERIIYTSTFLALGPSDGSMVDEAFEREKPVSRNPYERTKWKANAMAIEKCREGLPLIVLYPGTLYGPGPLTEGNLIGAILLEHFGRRLRALPARGERIWPYAFIHDVAAGHLKALLHGTPGERYILGGENASFTTFFQLVEEMTGIPAPRRSLPYSAALIYGYFQEFLAFMLGHTPRLTPDIVEIFRHDWACSSKKAERELNYAITPLADGLRQTISWLKADENGSV